MASSLQLISTVTVGAGGAASIDFNSIPSTFTDLVIHLSHRFTANDATAYMQFNGSTTGYSFRNLLGFGSPSLVISQNSTRLDLGTLKNDTANTFGVATVYIPNYAGSTNKSISVDQSAESNQAANYNFLYAGLWSSTAVITSISLKVDSASYVQYSTASLYGITKGSLAGVTVS
jgi:hypothetical protein